MAKRVSEINRAVNAAVAEALEQARKNADVINQLRESAMNGTLTFRELKDRIPSTVGKKTPSEYVVRAFLSIPELILCEKEYDYGGKLTVFINGFYTYSDGGWMTILRVDGFSKVYFDRTEGSFMTVGEEEYKNRSYDYPLTLHGDWQIRKNRNKHYMNNETYCFDEVMENSINYATSKDLLDEMIEMENIDKKYKMLYMAFSELTNKQKKMLWLHYYKGYTQEQIAGIIKIRQQSVHDSLSASKNKIKKYLKKYL